MIADDSATIRASLAALIARLPGVEIVGMAETGVEAVKLARALKPDVMTLDVRMPEMTGLGVLEAMRGEEPAPMIIMLTGLAGIEYEQKCEELGAKYFFHKDTEFEKVIEILAEHNRRLNQPEPPETLPCECK